jgi:hypothetical protein
MFTQPTPHSIHIEEPLSREWKFGSSLLQLDMFVGTRALCLIR